MSGPVSEPFYINGREIMFSAFADYSKRLESFRNWPDFIPVSKEELAEAGFMYTGVGDFVKCFACGGGRLCWQKNHVPMEEHAREFPECPHILQVKGKEFVNKICHRKNQYFLKLNGTVAIETAEFDWFREEKWERLFNTEKPSCQHPDLPRRFWEESRTSEKKTEPSYLHLDILRRFCEEKRNSGRKKGWAFKIIDSLMNVINGTLETATEVMSLLVKKYPELFPNLDRTPTQKDLLSFAQAIGENFRYFGLALGVGDVSLDQISMENPTVVMKTFKMLKKWCDENPLESSLSKLIQTLKTCSCVRVDWGQIGKLCL